MNTQYIIALLFFTFVWIVALVDGDYALSGLSVGLMWLTLGLMGTKK
jgi:hypothetical protein